MKLKRFYIQDKNKDSKIWLGLKRFKAQSENEALEMAKADWIKSWNLSFPHLNDGEKEVENIEFSVCK